MASSSSSSSNPQPKKRSYTSSKFTQQELPSSSPVLTPIWAISVVTLIGLVFIPIGVMCLLASKSVVEVVYQYETECIPENYRNDTVQYIKNPTTSKACTVLITVPKEMKRPVYVYYQLDNFYQNHKRYVTSRSDAQLRDPAKETDTDTCGPEDLYDDRGKGIPIVPCGMIAWSLFNDTYSFFTNNKTLEINKTNISWKSDREKRFGDQVYPKNFQNGVFQGGAHLDKNIPLSGQEDLIVWMRPAAFSNFRKLYGRVEEDLLAGQTIVVTIQNNYNTYSFHGTKKIVLSTAGSWLDVQNDNLGIMYLAVGAFCLVFAIVFTVAHFVKPRQLGDPSYYSWNRKTRQEHSSLNLDELVEGDEEMETMGGSNKRGELKERYSSS